MFAEPNGMPKKGLKSPAHFLKRFIAQTVYTVSTRINYKIVPVNILNNYLQYGKSGTK